MLLSRGRKDYPFAAMKLRSSIFTALMAAMLCLLAPLSVPVGALPVSAATFGVCLVALIADRRCALMAILLYVALGAVGLPVFAGFSGGAHVLVGPTGGYLFGYIPMAAVIGLLRGGRRTVGRMAVGMALGHLICYGLGVLWYAAAANVSLRAALSVGVLPFLPMDTVKAVAAGVLAIPLGRRVDAVFSLEEGRKDR